LNQPAHFCAVQDYAKTFEKLKKLDVDVFLAAHGNFFDLEEKSEKIRREREPNPFVDPKKYKEFIERTEKQFRERLEKQKEESIKREKD
jgi:metallo-beta-lactamase class B